MPFNETPVNSAKVGNISANAHGVYLRTEEHAIRIEVERITPLSTIGAGDTFNAGLLYGIHRKGIGRDRIGKLGREEWEELLSLAITFSREVCLSYDNYLPREIAERYRSAE